MVNAPGGGIESGRGAQCQSTGSQTGCCHLSSFRFWLFVFVFVFVFFLSLLLSSLLHLLLSLLFPIGGLRVNNMEDGSWSSVSVVSILILIPLMLVLMLVLVASIEVWRLLYCRVSVSKCLCCFVLCCCCYCAIYLCCRWSVIIKNKRRVFLVTFITVHDVLPGWCLSLSSWEFTMLGNNPEA